MIFWVFVGMWGFVAVAWVHTAILLPIILVVGANANQ